MTEIFQDLADALAAGRDVALVTVIKAQGSTPQKAGRHMLVFPDGALRGTIGGGTIEHRVVEEALACLKTGGTRLYSAHLTRDLAMCCGGTMEVFIEAMTRAPQLILFGGGHVNEALAPMAQAAGFAVTVVDEREAFAEAGRFPEGVKTVWEDPLDALPRLPLGPSAYLLIVTHSHRQDEALLRRLLQAPFGPKAWAYLGMIGSKAKVARFVTRLKARGVEDGALERVHMPIGLDIGAVTPAEIAVSILAELIQVRRKGQSQPQTASMGMMPQAHRALTEGGDSEEDVL